MFTPRRRSAGFTLLELLIASAMMLILLGVVAEGIQSSGRTALQVMTRSDLLEETRVTGQMIADEMSKAVYVYPPGAVLQLNKTVSPFVTNPLKGGNVWTVGIDPIVAYVEAPRDSAAACPAGCLTFVAYIALNRGQIYQATLDSSGAEQTNNPGYDSLNNDGWLIYEYKVPLADRVLTASVAPPVDSSQLTNASADLVADYIAPGGFALEGAVCRNADGFLQDAAGNKIATVATPSGPRIDGSKGQTPGCPSASAVVWKGGQYKASVARASLLLRAQAKRSAGSIYTTTPISFPILPRNLYSQ